jgi:hypothetical protein
MPLRENDPQSQARLAAFSQALMQIGWVERKAHRFRKTIFGW